uniref:Uncharacterized protein n=1 Tax=Cryptomonas curvata TaxID=233186 RepID=A0A7S0MZS8_9CRYP
MDNKVGRQNQQVDSEGLVQFHRILPCLDASDVDFAKLQPIGVFPEVAKYRSPDYATTNMLISQLWPAPKPATFFQPHPPPAAARPPPAPSASLPPPHGKTPKRRLSS